MERPFDTPDMVEPTGFDPYQLTKAETKPMVREYDDYGGHTTVWSLWFAPEWWTPEQIRQAVSFHLPAEHCQHSYDCCGRYYGNRGRVLDIDPHARDDNGDLAQAVLVRRDYVQNV